MDVESKVVELLQRMERIVVMQEQVEERCERRIERIMQIEERQDDLDKKLAVQEEQAKKLSSMIQELHTENKKLCTLVKGMVVLLCLTLAAMSLLGIEAFPFLFEMIKKLVL